MSFLYCLLYLAGMGILVFLIGRFFPRKWIKENAFPFRCYRFEKQGKIYEKIKIKRWKTKWPDASMLLHAVFRRHYPKKRIEGTDREKVSILIKESCVAESTHVVVSILGVFCIKIWKGMGGVLTSVGWILFNLPPIVIQRYNRPRLQKALNACKRIEKACA